jgi:quinoprotein glucose dehydrogenase
MRFRSTRALARVRLCFGCGCLAALGASAGNLEQTVPWPAYGGGPGGGHFSSATQITAQNVTDLAIAWEHRSGDVRSSRADMLNAEARVDQLPKSSFMATPIVVDDTLYYCTPFNRVFALDPVTGKERWSFDPKVDMPHEPLTNCRGVSSWHNREASAEPKPCDHRILAGTLDGRIIALDGATGARCPDFGTNGEVDLNVGLTPHDAAEYAITSAPAILGNMVITGAMVADSRRADVPSGVVRAYDVRTGAFLWGWNSVPRGVAPTDAQGRYVAGTTNVWSTISVDPERNLVIVPTGNSSPDYYGGDRGGNLDYYSSSVVALDGSDGHVVWHYQTVHHDIWDYDVPAQPTFVDLEMGDAVHPAVVQVTKMGITFVLDRATGQPLFPVEERPVPQDGAAPGEYLSPTQPFPAKPAALHQLGVSPDDAWGFTFWDKGQCREALEKLRTGPIYTPPSLEGTVVYPGMLGGNNWGAPAVDPTRHVMIANTKHMAMVVKLVPRAQCNDKAPMPQLGSQYCVSIIPLMSRLGAPCTPPPWSTLAAVDLESGEILWQKPFGTLANLAPWPISMMEGGVEMGGPMVTASGLVFIAASFDGQFRAFDIATGDELWSDELPTSGNAVPMSYVSGGRQFVVIAAGSHWVAPTEAGDHLIAYALPEH